MENCIELSFFAESVCMRAVRQEPVTADNAGERLSTRCERETLSRFPRTGAILFTIRTHQRQLKTFEGRPDKVRLLSQSLCRSSHLKG